MEIQNNDNSYIERTDVCLPLESPHNKPLRETPSWSTYLFYSTLSVALSPLTLVARLSLWVTDFFRTKNHEHLALKQHIKHYLCEKPLFKASLTENSRIILLTERIFQASSPFFKPVLLDIIALNRHLSHIAPILEGATVKIESDAGVFFDKWKALPGAHPRKSSHASDEEGAYSIQDGFLQEFLFWKDAKTHTTKFQLERSRFYPFFHPVSAILHARDYLNYKRLGKQQGPFGESHATDKNPLHIRYNVKEFEENRQKWLVTKGNTPAGDHLPNLQPA